MQLFQSEKKEEKNKKMITSLFVFALNLGFLTYPYSPHTTPYIHI
jgi:hypothetical protein